MTEWIKAFCLKFYILQSRPITTVTKEKYEEYIYLDETLPLGQDFLFEKTEISEIAPRPTTIRQKRHSQIKHRKFLKRLRTNFRDQPPRLQIVEN